MKHPKIIRTPYTNKKDTNRKEWGKELSGSYMNRKLDKSLKTLLDVGLKKEDLLIEFGVLERIVDTIYGGEIKEELRKHNLLGYISTIKGRIHERGGALTVGDVKEIRKIIKERGISDKDLNILLPLVIIASFRELKYNEVYILVGVRKGRNTRMGVYLNVRWTENCPIVTYGGETPFKSSEFFSLLKYFGWEDTWKGAGMY